jgi:Predicted secreted endonuclease distantly related to archaeal Holliday junction resolvase
MMNLRNEARNIIKILETGGFYAECPCCEEPILLKKANLFYLDDFNSEALELYKQQKDELRDREKELEDRRKSISQKSEIGAKSVNIGFILERLAPTMRDFRFDRNDCRSLFDPIDYVIFEGLSKRGTVSKVLFTDIKTGGARLKSIQKEIKSLVERKKVDWDTYRVEDSK